MADGYMDIEKRKKLNALCEKFLKECAAADFTVADVRKVPEHLQEIIDISVRIDERNFSAAIERTNQ